MLLQHPQVKLHHVPANQHVRVMLCKPLVQRVKQLRAAVEIDQLKIQRAGITVWRAEHKDLALTAPLQPDAVKLAVLRGFNIQ